MRVFGFLRAVVAYWKHFEGEPICDYPWLRLKSSWQMARWLFWE